jgi:hypothetical protein
MTTKKAASPEFLAAVLKADSARRARRAAEIRELIKTIPVSDELLKEIAGLARASGQPSSKVTRGMANTRS